MEKIEPEQKKPSYEELAQQNLDLRQELSTLKTEKYSLWTMLAGTSRRLQMSSAAIKAAVSSLLNYDIFWDGANQHEFLKTIDASVDQASRLVKLLALAFSLEAGSLDLKREPQVIQEIISVVQDHTAVRLPNLGFGVILPQAGMPVLVNYEYLMMALEYLVEAIEQMGIHRIGIQAVEEPNRWILQFEGLDAPSLQIIQAAWSDAAGRGSTAPLISSEQLLRLHVVHQILKLQEITFELPDSFDLPSKLRLMVPSQVLS